MLEVRTIAGTNDWEVVGDLFGERAQVKRGDFFECLRFVKENS